MPGRHWLASFLLALSWAQVSYGDTLLPPSCLSLGENAWWKPLRSANGSDPCQIFQELINADFRTGCCPNGPETINNITCGPCTQESYNIVMACYLCTADPTAFLTRPPDQDAMASTQPLSLNLGSNFRFSDFKKGEIRSGVALPIDIIPWMNTPHKEDYFDAAGAVAFAKVNPASETSDQPAPSGLATLSTVSPIASHPPPGISTTHSSPFQPSTTVQISKVGLIAGGTIGGVILLGVVIFLVVFIRRRQRNKFIMISEENPYNPSQGQRRRLINIEPYIIGTLENEKMQENTGSVGKSQGGRRSISATNIQDLTWRTQFNNTGNRRAMDAGPVSRDVDSEADGCSTLPPDYADVFQNASGSSMNPSKRITM